MKRMALRSSTGHRETVALESFDLNLLRVLDALLSAGSVSGATHRLNLSQPAASAALARLRNALDDPLMVRNGNRMAATPLAQELAPRVRRILEDIGQALSAAASFDPAATQRHFRIAASDYASLVLLAPLAQRLREKAPQATLEILPADASADARLASRELDLLVSDHWGLRHVRGVETLFHESFVTIARADHPRLPRRLTLKAFLAEDHALISPNGLSPGVLDHALAAAGHSRRVALTVPHYLAAPAIVAHTDLIMTLPSRIARSLALSRQLRVHRPPVALKGFDVVMASHPRSAADPSVQWLMSLVRTVAKGLGGPVAASGKN